MVDVCRVCIIYPDLWELLFLGHPQVRLVIANSLFAILAGPRHHFVITKSWSANMVGSKVSFNPLQDLVITKSWSAILAGPKVSLSEMHNLSTTGGANTLIYLIIIQQPKHRVHQNSLMFII